MAEVNGGQIAAKQLRAAGIDTIFGVVAGPMIEVMAGCVEEGIRVVNCRHEESAAFMASAWGYIHRKPGVIVAGSGPAVTNTVTSMHVATESSMPLVVLGGSVYSSTRGWGGFQEAAQNAFAAPGCKWNQQVDSTERIADLLHLALGKSVTGRPGAVYLDFPGDVVSRRIPEEKARLRNHAPRIARPHPEPAAIEQIADMLTDAERPLLVVGKGAAWADAGGALAQLADLGIPYVTSPMARGTIPDDHAQFVNAARSAALQGADAILMVGGRFNWIFQFGRQPRYAEDVRIAQIDVEAEEAYSSANVELAVVADAAVAAEQLVQAMAGRRLRSADGAWSRALREKREANAKAVAKHATSDATPINPYRLVQEIADVAPRGASIAVDGEIIMGVARVLLPSYAPRARLNAGTTGCMGTGVPYTLGAKLARPEHASIGVLGDYAFGAAALELETAARVGIPAVFVVGNNQGIAGHSIQDGMFPPNSPRIASLLPANYEKLAELVDGHAERVEKPADIRPALERALASDRPAVVHVLTDPKAGRVGGGMYLR